MGNNSEKQAAPAPRPLAEPRQFRKKPVVIEAMLWTGEDNETGIQAAVKFCHPLPKAPDDPHIHSGLGYTPPDGKLYIPTLEGTMCANPGDWIIKGVKGEFYPCKPDIFAATYEPAAALAPRVESPQPQESPTVKFYCELTQVVGNDAANDLLTSRNKWHLLCSNDAVRLNPALACVDDILKTLARADSGAMPPQQNSTDGSGSSLASRTLSSATSESLNATKSEYSVEPLITMFRSRQMDFEPLIHTERSVQKHLDEGTAERVYWHYGYSVALSDVIRQLEALAAPRISGAEPKEK